MFTFPSDSASGEGIQIVEIIVVGLGNLASSECIHIELPDYWLAFILQALYHNS